MKQYIKNIIGILLVLLLLILSISSCDKELNGNCNIILTVQFNGKIVDQGNAFIKIKTSDSSSNAFLKRAEIDVYGQVYFPDIKPGQYIIYAEKYDLQNNRLVKKTKQIVVKNSNRWNEYEINLELEP